MRLLTLEKAIFLLLGVFLFFGCKPEKVDNPFTNANLDDFREGTENFCEIFVTGRVINSHTLKGIRNAEVRVDNLVGFTDEDGNYTLKVTEIPDLLESERLVVVTKLEDLTDPNADQEFVPSYFRIDFNECLDVSNCDGTEENYEVDFLMTPIQPRTIRRGATGFITVVDSSRAVFFNAGQPDTLTIYDTLLVRLAPTLPISVRMSFTPINPLQYIDVPPTVEIGDARFRETVIKRFHVEPAGLRTIGKFTIVANPDFPVDETDALGFYIYSEINNEWIEDLNSSTSVRYNANTRKIEVSTELSLVGNNYMIVNKTDFLRIQENLCGDFDGQERCIFTTERRIENCDCSTSRDYEELIEFEGGTNFTIDLVNVEEDLLTFDVAQILANPNLTDEQKDLYVRIKLYNLIRQTYALPSDGSFLIDGSVTDGADSDLSAEFNFERGEVTLNGVVEKCDVEVLKVCIKARIVTGQLLGIDFELIDPIGVEVDIDNESCLSPTQCHQGCPE